MKISAVPESSANETITVRVGRTLVLEATFTNFELPITNITWVHNDSILVNDTQNRVSIVHSNFDPPNATSTLTRSSIAGISDAGTYTVMAMNRAGSGSTTFTVQVTGWIIIIYYA